MTLTSCPSLRASGFGFEQRVPVRWRHRHDPQEGLRRDHGDRGRRTSHGDVDGHQRKPGARIFGAYTLQLFPSDPAEVWVSVLEHRPTSRSRTDQHARPKEQSSLLETVDEMQRQTSDHIPDRGATQRCVLRSSPMEGIQAPSPKYGRGSDRYLI